MITINKIGAIAFLFISIFLVGGCWDEPCKFDNSSTWHSTDSPGIYNCIDVDRECKGSEKCTLFMKGPEDGAEWESTGETHIRRPRGMENKNDDPNSYKCECE